MFMNQKYEDFWKPIKKERLITTPFIDVYEEQLESKEGKKATYYTVNRRSFAATVPFWPDGSTLLVGEWRHGVKDFSWGFPMGFLDDKEEPIKAAKRELEEETGYTAEEFVETGQSVVSPSFNGSHQYSYLALDPSLTGQKPDGEISEFKKVKFEEVAALIVNGEVTDNNVVTAYFLAKEYLIKEGLLK